MDISKQLQYHIDIHNDLVAEEQDVEQRLLQIRESRIRQLGKIEALKELMETELKEASLEASSKSRVGKVEVLETSASS